ncbi:MAG: class I SAM-dependent methyltransferase [Patescibacteria group bacterium]
MPQKPDWSEFYAITQHASPSALLFKALGYVQHRGRAIDIGGGALKDTRYLLEQGFEVTVIDKEELMAQVARAIHSVKLHFVITAFVDFDFPKNTFDLASAMFALPFNPPDTFEAVIQKIKASLVPGGIFCGQLFGAHDEWSSNPDMTFHTKEQAEKLFSDLKIIELAEEERDGKLANGTPKHWHVFNFIVRQK